MAIYSKHLGSIRNPILGAVALSLLLGFLLQNVVGSVYYALLMGPNTTVTSPPVELQNGTAGTSTIYANKTSALVSVEPSGALGTDVKDYVDNNTSNVDGSADRGTHSNFTAQQYGPDLINDTLTEENIGGTGSNSTLLYVNADNGAKTDWTRVGTSPFLDAIDYTNYVNVSGNSKSVGDFGFTDSGRYWGTINSVTVQIYAKQSASKDLQVFVWNGSSWTSLGTQILTTSWRWENYSATTVLNTWTKINGAKIYLQTMSPIGTYEVDCARLKVDYIDTDNYELDLEVQWTSVDYVEPYELLCIYGGTMGAEDIRVDAWHNSAWQNVFIHLSSGWNNVSIGSYLDSSTFTIRFKGGTEGGDPMQDTWKIDAVLLHVWAGNEVLGNATTVTEGTENDRPTSTSKDRVVLRTADPSNTLHVFQLGDSLNAQQVFWWRSIDNGQTWSEACSDFGPATSISVKKDSNNYIHLVWAHPVGAIYYKKQLYNATSWGSNVQVDFSYTYQPDVAISPYNNSWVYVVYDMHYNAPTDNEVYVKYSTDGGASFVEVAERLTYNELTTSATAGTFPSIVIDNTLGTYGRIFVTWFRGDSYLYLRRAQITSTGEVNFTKANTFDPNVYTISSNMEVASTSEDTNMMHSAMYANGKYRVVYCNHETAWFWEGVAHYRDWDESSWSDEISLEVVSNYPSLTYDSNNYIYVLYHSANFGIRYKKSTDKTPTGFGCAQNVTDNTEGDGYVSAKLGGDNNRVEFAWTYNTSSQHSSYQVKYNYIADGGKGDFDYVLKLVEKDNSNWKVRLKAYDDSNKDRLKNCSIYIYNGSNSTQIVILNGAYSQQNGSWYDLTASDTEYIWMHVETSSAGTSYVYAYLEILVPNKTTYARYIITFKID